MMNTQFISLNPLIGRAFVCAAGAVLLFSLAGCEVKKTESGEAPKVSVDPGKMPKYEVETAKVGVTTEQKTITVPKVNVTMPGDATPTPAPDATLTPAPTVTPTPAPTATP